MMRTVTRWTPSAPTAAALAALAPAFGGDDVRREVLAELIEGVATLWCVEPLGWMVTRLEAGPLGPELVAVAGAGRGVDVALVSLCTVARLQGAVTVRAHALRLGMRRVLTRHGFERAGIGGDGLPYYRRNLEVH